VKIFLDSSKVEEARRWMPVIDGITTNPSILLKEGGDIRELAKAVFPLPISIEASGDFITEAREYSKIEDAMPVIKVPLLKPDGGDNLSIIKSLTDEGVVINCTALMSLSQVILATKAGARYVSLFAGRVEDEGGYSTQMIIDCINFLENEDSETELIVGSIRTVGNVLDAVRAEAHIVTIPPPILEKMLRHNYSLVTVQQFEKAAEELRR